MRILITAGPTQEPIDPVRYIGNRSSGKLGAAVASAALAARHQVTLVLGPVSIAFPPAAKRIDVQTSQEMYDAVLREFPSHDLLIMAAAVADYRPVAASPVKLARDGSLTLELQATEDIAAAVGRIKRADQRSIGFSLESTPDFGRVGNKMRQKNLDMIVHNPIETISSDSIEPTLLYPDGRSETLPSRPKGDFADILLQRAAGLFPNFGR